MAVLRIKSPRTGRVSYKAVVTFRDETGKRRQLTRNVATRSAAKKAEAELIRARDEGVVRASGERLLFGTYIPQWLAQQHALRETTRTLYRQLTAHLIADIGHVPLNRVTPIQLLQVYGRLRTEGKSEQTILLVHRVTRKLLKDAVRLGLAMRNVADLVDAPKPDRYEHTVLGIDEIRAIFAVADDTEYGTFIRLATWTGLRLGELTALTWADIDLDAATLRVRNAYDKLGKLSTPKTEHSKRRISLSPETVRLLTAQHVGITDPAALVFRRPDGSPFTHALVNHAWRSIRTKAGVPRARFHDLRHAHASHLLAAGWSLADVSARLGHTAITTTLNTYTHALPGRDAELAKAVDRIFV